MKLGISYYYQPSEDAYEVSYAKRQRNRDKMTAKIKGNTPLRQMAWETLN